VSDDVFGAVASLLGAAASATEIDARALFVARARQKCEAVAERLREVRILCDAAEAELLRRAAPEQQEFPA
jgi:hypothetical protein